MAKNWTMAEATKAIIDGSNDAAIQDLGRRFPLTTVKISQIGAKAPEIVDLMAAFPSHMTVRKIESTLKNGVEEIEIDDFEEEDEEPEEKPAKAKKVPAKKAAAKKAEEDEDEGKYAGMSAMDLYKECKNRGIKAAAKKPAKYYVELLEKDDASADDDWEDEPEKPAKKAAKKPAAKKAAAKKAEPEDDDDDDEWDI